MNATCPHGADRNPLDERANAIIHMVGAVLALLGAAVLIAKASVPGKPWHIVGFSVYSVGLVSVFVSSALHHGVVASPRAMHHLRQLDYISIFLLIAGTFTPCCLTVARTVTGWCVLGVVWLVAVLGIALKAARSDLPEWTTLTLYIAMGWLALALAPDLADVLPARAIALLAAGGVVYTVGGAFFYADRPGRRFLGLGSHAIWHLCVLGGAILHYVFLLWYVLPYGN